MDAGAAPAPLTVSSDAFRVAYEASTSWMVAKEGLFGDGQLGIHHPQLNPPSYHRLPEYLEASRAPDVFDHPTDSPQKAVAQTRNVSAMAAMRKLGAASANLARTEEEDARRHHQPEAAAGGGGPQGQQDRLRCADGVDGVARLVKENSDLVKLPEERDKFIELNGAKLQNLRLANWQLAQPNSQMLAKLNLRKTRLKSLQH